MAGGGTCREIHCMKNIIFVKTHNVNIIFSWFSANDRNMKVKWNIFSTISDGFRKKSIQQDNDKKWLEDEILYHAMGKYQWDCINVCIVLL